MARRRGGYAAWLYYLLRPGRPGCRPLGLRHADPRRLRRRGPRGDGWGAAEARASHPLQPAARRLDLAGRRARRRGSPARDCDDRPHDGPFAWRFRGPAPGRAGRGIGGPLKRVIAGLGLAAVVWTAAFRGPRSQFWLRMTLGVGGLGAYALAVEPALRHERPRLRDVFKGLGSAAGLYAVFQVGDRMARRIMPAGDREIAAIYQLRKAAPPEAIASVLALVIGPGEELFWRGLVQRGLMRRFGRLRGTLLASSIYGAIHLVSANLTLTGAAGTAGLFWGAVFAREQRMSPLIVSHVSWDIWIFLIAPTG